MAAMTETDIYNVSKLLNGFRADWDVSALHGTFHGLLRTHGGVDRRLIAIAALVKALDDTCESPTEIGDDGPHWKLAQYGPLLGATGRPRYASVADRNTLTDLDRARARHDPAKARAGYLASTEALKRAREKRKVLGGTGGATSVGAAADG